MTALNWAGAASVRRIDFACVLIDERRANVQPRITQNPHVLTIEVPLPTLEERTKYIATLAGASSAGSRAFGDGLTPRTTRRKQRALRSTISRLRFAPRSRDKDTLDHAAFARLKKALIERQCHGLLEFVEPHLTLDDVVGLEAAKRTLREDARLLVQGHRELAPMGYLICGPVGTGKTFLAMCAAGEVGMPVVTLKNFRSKYVGETEANLEHVLSVLRAMGPVMVLVDEADAMLGDRESDGDAGVSSRVFGMIANQMGNTAYRGQIVWVLMTARPDLLPIDLKRQGRAEIHIPLFYPDDPAELRAMLRGWPERSARSSMPEPSPTIWPSRISVSSPAPTSRES